MIIPPATAIGCVVYVAVWIVGVLLALYAAVMIVVYLSPDSRIALFVIDLLAIGWLMGAAHKN